MNYSIDRWKRLAGISSSENVEEPKTLTEGIRNLGMANPGIMGNPFGHREDLETVLEEMSPELDPEKVNVEDDHEGEMARGQLETICNQAKQLLEKLPEDAKLEAWVQSKLTLAAEMMDVVAHYLQDEAGDDQEDESEEK